MSDTLEQNTNNNVEKPYTDPETGKFAKGNPGGGRPPGSFSLLAILKEELQKVPEGRQKSYAQELITSMLHKGIIEKDSTTQKLIMNYIEGLPKLPIEFSGSIDFHKPSKETQDQIDKAMSDINE